MRCSLQLVYNWTEELSIRTNGTNRKASLTNGGFYQCYHWWRPPLVEASIGEGFLMIGICLCILDMCEFLAQPTEYGLTLTELTRNLQQLQQKTFSMQKCPC